MRIPSARTSVPATTDTMSWPKMAIAVWPRPKVESLGGGGVSGRPGASWIVLLDEKPYIFFAHGQSLWNISMDGKDFQLQRAGLQKTAMLDIDASVSTRRVSIGSPVTTSGIFQDKMIYYVDIGANKLERIRFEGVFPQTLQSYDLEGTEGLGVDWVGR